MMLFSLVGDGSPLIPTRITVSKLYWSAFCLAERRVSAEAFCAVPSTAMSHDSLGSSIFFGIALGAYVAPRTIWTTVSQSDFPPVIAARDARIIAAATSVFMDRIGFEVRSFFASMIGCLAPAGINCAWA